MFNIVGCHQAEERRDQVSAYRLYSQPLECSPSRRRLEMHSLVAPEQRKGPIGRMSGSLRREQGH